MQISESLEREPLNEQTPETYEQGSEPMQHYGEYNESAILILPLSVSFPCVSLALYFSISFLTPYVKSTMRSIALIEILDTSSNICLFAGISDGNMWYLLVSICLPYLSK